MDVKLGEQDSFHTSKHTKNTQQNVQEPLQLDEHKSDIPGASVSPQNVSTIIDLIIAHTPISAQ